MAFQRDFTTFYCYISEELLFGKDLYAGKDWISQVALVVKSLPANAGDVETWVRSLDWEDPQVEEMANLNTLSAPDFPKEQDPCPRMQSSPELSGKSFQSL